MAEKEAELIQISDDDVAETIKSAPKLIELPACK